MNTIRRRACTRFAVLCTIFVAAIFVCGRAQASDESLIGWNGDTYNAASVFGDKQADDVQATTQPVQISRSPLAYVWENFISRDEARHIATLAAPLLQRSGVGISTHSRKEVRTSYGMFIPRHQDAVIARINERVAAWVGVPVAYQESMQVLRYAEGQQYRPHMDSNGRMATVLIYLTDTPDGGETTFSATDESHWLNAADAVPSHELSECARGHVSVKPAVGRALLFWSLPAASVHEPALRDAADPFSQHAGCPPVTGTKWTATVWVHWEPYLPTKLKPAPGPPLPDPLRCADYHKSCKKWAADGVCTDNPDYMVGSTMSVGRCRLACNACRPCADGDAECTERLREELGLLPNSEQEVEMLFGP